jgi:hypothetical protein
VPFLGHCGFGGDCAASLARGLNGIPG